MRKAISVTIAILLIIMLLPACSSDTTASEKTEELTMTGSSTEQTTGGLPSDPAAVDSSYEKPLDLFGEELNPFSNVEFPDGYTPYKVDVSMNTDLGFYALSLLTEDPKVVDFTASLLNITDEDDIAALTQALRESRMQETGIYGDTLEMEITVKPVEADSKYYTEAAGYTVTLSTKLDGDMLASYKQILAKNISESAFESVGAEALIDQFDLSSNGSITVVTGSVNYLNSRFSYELGDEFNKWNDYFLSGAYLGQDTVSDWGEKNVSAFNYGELATHVTLDPEKNSISFNQEVESTDINISDYVPPLSLIQVGFDKMCNYNSEDGSIYVGIRKEIFGDTGEGDDINYIQYSDSGYDCYLVKYYRPEGKYYVQMQKDGLKAEYCYDVFEDTYTDLDGGEDVSEQKETMQRIMNTDADMVMGEPIVTFERYIKDTFGVNSDALYDLPLQ